MTHPGRKCSALQNTFCFIICELPTDGDWRLTAFHYMEDVRFAGNRRCLQIVMACDAHGQVGSPPTPEEVQRITPFFLLKHQPVIWQEEQGLSLNRNALFSA